MFYGGPCHSVPLPSPCIYIESPTREPWFPRLSLRLPIRKKQRWEARGLTCMRRGHGAVSPCPLLWEFRREMFIWSNLGYRLRVAIYTKTKNGCRAVTACVTAIFCLLEMLVRRCVSWLRCQRLDMEYLRGGHVCRMYARVIPVAQYISCE